MSPGRRSGLEPKPETAETGFAATVSSIMPRTAGDDQPLGGHPVFLTVAEVREDRVTRRVFLTLAPAQRVVEAARARGVQARLYVLEAHPAAEVAVGDRAVAR